MKKSTSFITSRQHRRSAHGGPELLSQGLMQQRAGNPDAAARAFQRAIKLQRRDPRAYLLLARLQHQEGHIKDSIKTYRQCLQHDPNNIEALINLGMLCNACGDLETALDCYQRAINQAPDIPEAHNNLGNVLRVLGRRAEAVSSYQRAIELKADFAGAWHNLGRLQLEDNDLPAALLSLRRACSLPGSNETMLHDLADCLSLFPMTTHDPDIEADLEKCLRLQRTDGRLLGQATARYLCTQAFADRSETGLPTDFDAIMPRFTSPLLTALMYREPICDPHLESLLTVARRRQLLAESVDGEPPAWLAALAYQCYLNEYVWSETEPEVTAIDQLEQDLQGELQTGNTPNETRLSLYACYRPLNRLGLQAAPARAMSAEATPEFSCLLRQQVLEPAIELALQDDMECLSSVSDEVSNAVRMQYEQNPYPRWQMVDQPVASDLGGYLRGLFPGSRNAGLEFPGSLRILIAGCGTGLQAIRMARRIPAADITAIDLSRASLAYGKRRAQELGHAEQIRFAQADILSLTPAVGRFDCIECFGVLHHMADPEAGLRSLRTLSTPGGVMRIGLYSERARQPIQAARALIREHALTPTLTDIRRCRELIAGLPAAHPASVLIYSPDFYSTSECRDLLFHVQEQQLNLQIIAAMLERLELEFLGFEFNSLAALARYRNRFPEDPEAVDLKNWDTLEQEQPDTFSAQYVFWARSCK